jgi:hypothetical protein
MWRAKTWLKIGGSYADAKSVEWELDKARGLELRPSGGDGVWKIGTFKGVDAVVSAANPHSGSRYVYFNVDDAFAYGLFGQTVLVYVTFRDAGYSSFRLDYDSSNARMGPHEGAFRPVGNIVVDGTGKWRTAEFKLPECRFMGRCNGADFRVAVSGGDLELSISKAKLVKMQQLIHQ